MGGNFQIEEIGTIESAEKKFLWKEFWRKLLAKARDKTDLHSNSSPRYSYYLSTSLGKNGLEYVYIINNSSARSEIYIDNGKNLEELNLKIFHELHKHKDQIEQEFGKPLEWERLNGKRACRISYTFKGVGLKHREKWDALQDKMIDAMVRLERSFRKYIDKLP